MGLTPGIFPQAQKSFPWLQERRCALLRAYPQGSTSPKGQLVCSSPTTLCCPSRQSASLCAMCPSYLLNSDTGRDSIQVPGARWMPVALIPGPTGCALITSFQRPWIAQCWGDFALASRSRSTDGLWTQRELKGACKEFSIAVKSHFMLYRSLQHIADEDNLTETCTLHASEAT